jgi:hypothetical protein
MNFEYLPSFIKDLKVLRGNPVYQTIYAITFEETTELIDEQDNCIVSFNFQGLRVCTEHLCGG